jgi:hypothetical protein
LAIFAEFFGGTLCRSLGLIKESQDADPDVSDGETTPDARPPSSGQETGRRRSSIIDVARAILDKGSRTSSLLSKFILHCKQRLMIFPSPAGMSITKLSIKLFPARESLVSDIPAGDSVLMLGRTSGFKRIR